MSNVDKNQFVKKSMVLSALSLALGLSIYVDASVAGDFPTAKVNTTGLSVTDDVVKVGILHSATGTMAISETGSIQAEKLAIAQINEAGGVLGRKIEVIRPNFPATE